MAKNKQPSVPEELTLEDKVRLLTGYESLYAAMLPEKGLTGLRMTDGPYGVKTKDGNAVCLMNPCLMASSWDEETCYRMGRIIGEEVCRCGVDMMLAPAINIKRNPLAGRNFEYYSEDPFLTGTLAAAYARGVKDGGAEVCVKHFACNNQEKNRFVSNSVVSEDAMRNIYLKAFEIVLGKVKADAVMTAYNLVNGDLACENEFLLKKVLRDEWGFEGVVMSDWCAVGDIVKAYRNGLDLEMPGNAHNIVHKVLAAVKDGRITEEEIDEKVARILEMYRSRPQKKGDGTAAPKVDRAALVRMTAESFVMLKNGGALPLGRNEKILLVGFPASEPRIQGGGCAKLKTNFVTVPSEEIGKFAQKTAVAGYDVPNGELGKYDKIVVFLALGDDCDSEAFDRKSMNFPAEQVDAVARIAKKHKNVVAVLANGSAVDLSFEENVNAVLETYYAGSYGAEALAAALFGVVSPAGKLAETFPMRYEDVPSADTFGVEGDAEYLEGPFVGYRYYTTFGVKPRYPFGYGLSYCDFARKGFALERTGAHSFVISLDVTNLSDRMKGKDVVEVYLRSPRRFEPRMQLIAALPVRLDPSETRRVSVPLGEECFRYYSSGKKRFYEGEYEIVLATSSEDAIFAEKVVFAPVPRPVDRDTLLRDLLADPRLEAATMKAMRRVINVWCYGSRETEKDFRKEVFLYESVCNMPLRAFPYFDPEIFDDGDMERLIEELNRIV